MCVYIEMRPILCTKIHILCATTCAHSFCNKRRLFVFSFLIYFTRCVCFFFLRRHSHHRWCCWCLFLFTLGECFFMLLFFFFALWYSCFLIASNHFWHLSFSCYGSFSFNGSGFYWPNQVIFKCLPNRINCM